jgi:hypothetical protein
MEGVVHTDMIEKWINNGISLLWVFVCTVCRTAFKPRMGIRTKSMGKLLL